MRHDDSERGLTRGFSPSMTGCFSRIRRRRNPCHPQFLSAENHILKKLKIADLATLQTRSILYLGIGLQARISLHGHMWTIEGCFYRPTMRNRISLKSEIIGFFLTIAPYLIDDGNRRCFWLFHNWFGCALECIFQDVKANIKISLLTTYSVLTTLHFFTLNWTKNICIIPDICWSW